MMLFIMALLAGVGWGLSALMQMQNGATILFFILAFLAVELAAELVIVGWSVLPIHGLLYLLGLPFQFMRLRLRRGQRTLQQKNVTRAATAAFALVVVAVLAINGFPLIGWKVTAAIGAIALLYLVVGIHGRQGARFDAMKVFWWGALSLGCAALLVFIMGGFRL